MSDPVPPDEEMRLYAVVSRAALKKMGGNRGKLGAQLGHSYLHAYWDAEERHPERAKVYRSQGRAKKVVLVCEDDEVLKALADRYRPLCGVTVVVDAGLTVFAEPTFTGVGIGPLRPDERDAELAGLPVLI